ncbi:endonuclease/exonuclease/phosphatase family protein [Streptomyces sp. NPDC051183]|uniref:endonuclease/exonuclease/phosphatase family protein n=1 Tax=Streptomyces sp. NPDC051183 TaxID=3155165 RepID=UPI00344280E2
MSSGITRASAGPLPEPVHADTAKRTARRKGTSVIHRARRALVTVAALVLTGVGVATYATALPADGETGTMPYAVEDFSHSLQAKTGPLRVVTWNICGDAGSARGDGGYCPQRNFPAKKIQALTDLVAKHDANVIMLQEACGYTAHPGEPTANEKLSHMWRLDQVLSDDWQLVHAPGTRADGSKDCRPGSEPGLEGPFVGGEIGVLIAVKGGFAPGRTQIVESLPRDLTAADFTQLPAAESGNVLTQELQKLAKRKSPVLCVRPNAWAEKLCTTHLVPGLKGKKFPDIVRTLQSQLIRNELVTDFRNGIVIGGDLNASATSATLGGISGDLDRCATDPALHTHQTWTGATPSTYTLDHLFTDRRPGHHFSSCQVDQTLMDMTHQTPDTLPTTGVSDHAPVIAYF